MVLLQCRELNGSIGHVLDILKQSAMPKRGVGVCHGNTGVRKADKG